MTGIAGIFAVLLVSTIWEAAQTQSVSLCPIILAIQNRCPTQATTLGTSPRPTTVSNSNETDSSEGDVVDSCGMPVVTFCPSMQAFLSGARNCTEGETIQIRMTTLARLLINPSGDKATDIVGPNYVDALGNAFSSISKTIQATPTQATGTIGVTFIPVGQIIGGGK